MSDDRKDLPPVNSPNFLEKVREALSVYLGNRGNKLDRGLTLRDLSDAGIIDVNARYLAGGGSSPIGGLGSAVAEVVGVYEEDLTPPPTPTGFAAAAAISNLILTSDAATYPQGHGHAKARLYGATWTSGPLPVFASAVRLTEFTGTVGSYATNPATTWRLWLTWVTVDGVESIDPAGGTNGIAVTTGQDVALLLTALNGKLTSSQLSTSLSTPISLITADASVSGSVNQRLAAEAAARAAAIGVEASDRAAAILDEAAARALDVGDLQTQVDTIVAATGGDLSTVIAAVQAEQTARTTAIAAEAAARETLAVQIRGSYTGTDASVLTTGLIASERTARISAMEAEVTSRNAAIVSSAADAAATQQALNDAYIAAFDMANISNAALVSSETNNRIAAVTAETNARITAVSAEAAARQALAAVVDGNYAVLLNEQTVRANADSAMTSQINTVASSITTNNATLTAAIQTEATTRASQTGDLYAQYTVKLDVNGKVSGFGLASTGPTGAGSTFEIRADKFAIAAGTGTAAGFVPFQVLSAPTVIDGVTLPAGAYATNAFIQNLQVTNAKIANLAVDNAKIVDMNVDKLTAGSLKVGSYIQSADYTAGPSGVGYRIDRSAVILPPTSIRGLLTASQIDTRGLSIKDLSGNVILASGTALSTSYITGLGAFATLSQITSANVGTYIGSAAIGEAYIGNLNASKITTGTLSADRIAAGTITATKIVSGSVVRMFSSTNQNSLKNSNGTVLTAVSTLTECAMTRFRSCSRSQNFVCNFHGMVVPWVTNTKVQLDLKVDIVGLTRAQFDAWVALGYPALISGSTVNYGGVKLFSQLFSFYLNPQIDYGQGVQSIAFQCNTANNGSTDLFILCVGTQAAPLPAIFTYLNITLMANDW